MAADALKRGQHLGDGGAAASEAGTAMFTCWRRSIGLDPTTGLNEVLAHAPALGLFKKAHDHHDPVPADSHDDQRTSRIPRTPHCTRQSRQPFLPFVHVVV
jgi:hypothetical protein